MKILLLSGYDAASHQRWRLELAQHLAQHEWTQLALPARYFNWRIRGNSLTWAFTHREQLQQDYDLLIATSMVDLSALRGFVPKLASIPTVLYFHENQFSYPSKTTQVTSVEPQIISLYSALCADILVFNSTFNRTTFLTGVAELLRKLPDHIPPGLLNILRARSRVLAVPLADNCYSTVLATDLNPCLNTTSTNNIKPSFGKSSHRNSGGICNNVLVNLLTNTGYNPKPDKKTLTLIWNHRWEYDKGPERLLAMLQYYFAHYGNSDNHQFTLHVVGQQFRQQPAAFEQIKQLLITHNALGQWGYLESTACYRELMHASDLVLSTALHDFQGLAVLEAVAAGCIPLVPKRQAYPEWFGQEYCYASHLVQPELEAQEMAQQLQQLSQNFYTGTWPSLPDITAMNWKNLAPLYSALLLEVAENTKHTQ